MSERRPTAQCMSQETCERLIQVLREDRKKRVFVCKVVEKAIKACGIDAEIKTPVEHSRVLNYIWCASDIPSHDKPYAAAIVQYGSVRI